MVGLFSRGRVVWDGINLPATPFHDRFATAKGFNSLFVLRDNSRAPSSGATLVIARLDRLSRSASLALALRDSGVKFVCCDMPRGE